MADKKTPSKNISTLGAAELKTELRQITDKRARLVIQHQTAPLKNPMELRALRREIARIKTTLRSKEAAK
jgi:large subunit ribosomal protein L29